MLEGGGTGGQQGSKSQELLKGPKGSHSAPVPGKYLLAASSSFFFRFIPADKDRPSPGRKSPPSWEHHPTGCCLLFYYFLPRSCGRAPSWTSFLLGCVAFLLPSPLPGVAGSGGLGVLLTRSQKFVLPRDRYLGPLCCACHHRRRL